MPGVVQDPELTLTESERTELGRILSSPILYPEKFKGWLADWLATNIPKLPIDQVFGFKLERIRSATEIGASQSTASTSYVNLATTGPELTKLADGFYLLLFGCRITVRDTGGLYYSFMSPSINGGTPSDDDSAEALFNHMTRVVMKELRNDNNNTITMKYRVSGGTGNSIGGRWLHALKVSSEDV